MCFLKWKDKGIVIIASNFHRSDIIRSVDRKKKDTKRNYYMSKQCR